MRSYPPFLGPFHLIALAGFLADAYDLFVINVAVDIMSEEPYNERLTTGMKATVKSMALVGAIFGQLFFGSLADVCISLAS